MKIEKKQITIRIPIDLYEKIKKEAERGVTITTLVSIGFFVIKSFIQTVKFNRMKKAKRGLNHLTVETLFTLIKRINQTKDPELIRETTRILKVWLDNRS